MAVLFLRHCCFLSNFIRLPNCGTMRLYGQEHRGLSLVGNEELIVAIREMKKAKEKNRQLEWNEDECE